MVYLVLNINVMNKKILSIVALLTMNLGVNAQGISYETDTLNTFALGTNLGSSVFSDIDGDGDQDLFLVGNLPFVGPGGSIYKNDGAGVFTQSQSPSGLDNSSSAFADIDGDGDQDLVYTGTNFYLGFGVVSETKIFKNDGTGAFTHYTVVTGTLLTSGLQGVHSGSVNFGDVDADGDQDLLLSGYTNQSGNDTTILYENDGAGVFTTMIGAPFYSANHSSAKFLDIDGDTDLDVLLTGLNGSSGYPLLNFYKNDGAGNFTHFVSTIPGGEGVSYSAFDYSDIDGDGDLDILVTGKLISNQAFTAMYVNDGDGEFSVMGGTNFVDVYSGDVEFNDVDSDGDEDVLLTGTDGTNFYSKLYENNGSGIFTEVLNMPFLTSKEGCVDFADIDGDNDSDLVIIGTENAQGSIRTQIYINHSQQSSGLNSISENSSISIYPNPVQNELFIVLEKEEITQVKISALSGKIVKSINNTTSNSVDVSNLEKGVYILTVNTHNGVSNTRFVKK
jgi:hypothetical protein